MEQLANLNPEAATFITAIGIDRWSHAHCPRRRYKIMSTNIAELMNNTITDCRELPITGVVEFIRGVLQRWFHDHRAEALKVTTPLTTAADVVVALNDELARIYTVHPINFYTFLVRYGDLDGHVDLMAKTCTCQEFNLNRFPCAHALACIKLRGFSYADYCSPYYSSTSLVVAYSGEINPSGQPSDWLVPEDVAANVVLPLIGRRRPGRPKKNHILSFGEEVQRRSCTNCKRQVIIIALALIRSLQEYQATLRV